MKDKLVEITEQEYDDYLNKKIDDSDEFESFRAFSELYEKNDVKKHCDLKYYKNKNGVYWSIN